MKKALAIMFIILALFSGLYAATRVKGYYRKNGTYVQPHYRSNKNYTKYDNYSTKGNVNPYTEKKGYKKAY